MNREIKFRAWDEENKAMWFSDNNNGQEYCELYFTSSGKKFFKYGVYRPYKADGDVFDHVVEEEFEPSNGHWMQFTGLYDAQINGNEVYESDIIENCDTKELQEVYWNEDEAAWYCRYFYDKNRVVSLRDSLGNLNKKIGNIYETPELLK